MKQSPELTMCVIGDSFTAIGNYLPPLQQDLHIDKIYSYGISGTCIGGNEPNAFWQRYSVMEDDCAVVLIQGGTNDYGCSVPLGEPTDTIPDTFYGALQVLLSGLQEKYPHRKIVITTPSQRNWNGESENYTKDEIGINKAGYRLIDYVETIRYMAVQHGIILADLYEDCGITYVNALSYTTDGLHPNDMGAEMIAKCIANALMHSV